MAGKQIQFKEKQGHDKGFERNLLIFCAACIVFVIIAVNAVGGGGI